MNSTLPTRLDFHYHRRALTLFETTKWDKPIVMVFGDAGCGKGDVLAHVYNEVEMHHPMTSLLFSCGAGWNVSQLTKAVTAKICEAGLQSKWHLPDSWSKQPLQKQLSSFGVKHLFVDDIHKLHPQSIDHLIKMTHPLSGQSPLRIMASTSEDVENLSNRVPQVRGSYCGPLILPRLCWEALGEFLDEMTVGFHGLFDLARSSDREERNTLARTMLQYVQQITGGNLGLVARFGRCFDHRFPSGAASMARLEIIANEFQAAVVAHYDPNASVHVPLGEAIAWAYK
jgi:hypothetical protein